MMMISAVRTGSNHGRAGGFTLLEMVIVLTVSMMLVGGALAAVYFSRDEQKLTDASSGIELMAKRARTLATLQQRPYALEFFDGKVSMMPLAEAMIEPGEREMLIEANAGNEEVQAAKREIWQVEPDMAMLLKRWSANEWVPISDRNRQVWRFDPSGVCEPLGVRLVRGGSWISVMFHPLTAAIADTEMELR